MSQIDESFSKIRNTSQIIRGFVESIHSLSDTPTTIQAFSQLYETRMSYIMDLFEGLNQIPDSRRTVIIPVMFDRSNCGDSHFSREVVPKPQRQNLDQQFSSVIIDQLPLP